MTETAGLPGWQLEGNAAEAYERYLVPAIFAPWAEILADAAGLAPGQRVLDVACGTGVVARVAAERVQPGGSVTGLDLNPDMLAVARRISAGNQPPINWQQGDARSLPFPDGAFDVVLCQYALMFFPDRPAALAELRRVVDPGGRVAISVWRPLEHNPGWAALASALDRHAGADAAPMMRSPFTLGRPDELRELATTAGFAEVRIRLDATVVRYPSPREMIRQEAASSPLAGPLSALEPATMDQLVVTATELLRPYTDDDGIAFPAEALIITARG